MQTPIERMYHAAKVDIPAEAAHLMRIANHLQSCISIMDAQSARAGEPAVLTSMLHVGGDMHSVLSRAVTTMDNCSVALLITADDFVKTDDRAAADYAAMSTHLQNAPTPTHTPDELPANPEDDGYDVDTGFPPYPGEDNHVDPNPDPTDPDDESSGRGDGSEDQPAIPETERDW